VGILTWILFGAIAGWLASILAGRNERMGCFGNIAVGIVGALIGGVIFSALGGSGVTGFNIWSLFVAVIGAIVFLVVLDAIRRV
jgi:uncharacterized membrane protein YeaQ/YmgE (transglycosylase-associated protein family)